MAVGVVVVLGVVGIVAWGVTQTGAQKADGALGWGVWRTPPAPMPDPNAFDLYEKAFAAKDAIDQAQDYERPVPGLPGTPPTEVPWIWWDEGPSNVPPAERVKLYSEVYDLVKQALASECRLPSPVDNWEAFPDYLRFRKMARLLGMRASVKMAEGEYTEAASAAIDCIAMAQHVATGRYIMADLVAKDCEAMGVRALDEVIPHLDGTGCETALERLQAIEKARVPLDDTLAGHEGFDRRCFQELMAHPEQLGHYVDTEMSPGVREALLLMRLRAGSWEALCAHWAQVREQTARPYHQREEIPEPTDPFLLAVALDMKSLWVKDANMHAVFALRKLWLAARCYQLTEGRLPTKLEDLVTQYIKAVPADPFSDGFLRSRAAKGRLTIYSIGPDGVDDGGQMTQPHVRKETKGDIAVVVSRGRGASPVRRGIASPRTSALGSRRGAAAGNV